MKSLSTFEANLNRILRCLVGRLPLAEALPLLVREVKRPECLSRECVDLVQDTLAKRFTQLLSRSGWQHERFLVAGTPVSGRLWQRQQPEELGLSFTGNTLKTLIWMTAENAATSRSTAAVNVKELSAADHLFNLFAIEALQNTLIAPNLLMKPAFRENALIWLLYPNRMAEESTETPVCTANFDLWVQADHSWVLEALQDRLSQSIQAIEISKRRSSSQELMRRLGEIQTNVLSQFLESANAAGRRDLSWFLLKSASRILESFDADSRWLTRLNVDSLRLADRAKVYRAALALFHSLTKLHEWQTESLNVGFYDDNYQSSQYWKSEWESHNGNRIYARAQELIESVAPMRI